MKNLTFLLLILMYVSAYSQPTLQYDEYYGGPGFDRALDMLELDDGSLVMAGVTASYGAGSNDIWLYSRALGDDRSFDWSATFGWAGSEQAEAIAYFDEGDDSKGFLLGGFTTSDMTGNYNTEALLVKTDLNGESIWDKRYGEGRILEVVVCSDGYLLFGPRVIKTDFNGVEVWTYEMSSLCGTMVNNDVYVAKTIDGFISLVKISYDGNSASGITTPIIPGAGYINSLIVTTDGGFLMGITTSSYGAGLLDAMLIKTDGDGVLQWSETYGTAFHDECYDVNATIDGGYIFAGLTQELHTMDNDTWVVKVDANGSKQWDWTENLPYANWSYSVIQTEDDGYAISGFLNVDDQGDSDFRLIKFGPEDFQSWFTGFPTLIEAGENVKFNNGTLGFPGNYYTYKWTFDMGEGDPIIIDDDLAPLIPYQNDGSYDVKLEWFDESANLVSFQERTDYIYVGSGVGPPTGYCASNGNATNNWIELVSMNGISNSSISSGSVGYEDFTGITINVDAGVVYDITLDPGCIPSQKKVPKTWRVWIDFDLDGSFEGDEVLAIDNKKNEVTGSISIPGDFTGITRMRVSMSAEVIPVDCGYINSGEVEDYLVQVTASTPQPPVADFYADPVQVALNIPVYFYDQSANNPASYLWDFGDGTTSGDPNPIHSYSLTGTYTVTLTVSNSLGTDEEEKINYIEVTNSSAAYCIPENIQNSLITNIREVKIDEAYNYTGMNDDPYTYYSAKPPFELIIGGNHTVILTPGDTRARNFWRLWIDFDDSQSFDDNELLITANNKKGIINRSITIPGGLNDGFTTRMRVSMKRGGAQSGPCDGNFDGEVEDYDVIFNDGQKNFSVSNGSANLDRINIYPNPVHGDQLTLELPADGNKTIEIISKYGSVIDRFETGDLKRSLNVSNYASGMYYVKVTHAGTVEVKKFIKQ